MKTLTPLALIGVSLIFVVASAPLARGATVAEYTFTNNSLASSDADAHSTASDFAIGAALSGFTSFIAVSGNSPALSVGSDRTPGTEADAITQNSYFSFTVTPPTGGKLAFDQLSYNFVATNFSAPSMTENFSIRWSVDNFAANLGTDSTTVDASHSVLAGGGLDLSALPVQSGPVEFRLYLYDDQNASYDTVGIDSITLTATFIPPPPKYRLYALGDFATKATAHYSDANAINASGQIVGGATDSSLTDHAFVFADGVLKNLVPQKSFARSEAYGINAAGTIVGNRELVTSNALSGFIYENGKFTAINPLAGFDQCFPNAINASGQAVGVMAALNDDTNAPGFSFLNGTTSALTALAGDHCSIARAINDAGQIAGASKPTFGGSTGHAVLWTNASAAPTDLGVLGTGDSSDAEGINASGVIVGTSNLLPGGNSYHAFFYDGTMHDLGVGNAVGINTAGDIVGNSAGGMSLYTHGTMYALSSLVPAPFRGPFNTLSGTADAINDDGWIIGKNVEFDGHNHGLVAVPISFDIAPALVASDNTVPGIGNAAFSVIGPVAIDAAGDIAFRAVVKGTSAAAGIKTANNVGIWLYSGANKTLVAQTGATDQVTGATFTKLGDPALSSGGVLAFLGTLKASTGDATAANNTGIWVYKNGTMTLPVRASAMVESGANAQLSNPVLTSLSQFVVDDRGDLSLLAKVKGTNNNKSASGLGLLGTDNAATLTLLDRTGGRAKGLTAFKPLPKVQGQSRSANPHGLLAYLGPLGGRTLVLQEPLANGFTEHYLDLTQLNGIGVKTVGEPAVNDSGDAAFLATLTGSTVKPTDNTAIAVITNVAANTFTATFAARTGDTNAPDPTGAPGSAPFVKLSDPVLNKNHRVAFIGTLKTGAGTGTTGLTDTGIWSDADGTMKLIAREGDGAPGFGGGTFSSFDQLVLPDVGGVVFQATLADVPATHNKGVWALTPDGKLESIVLTGDALDLNGSQKTVKTIGIFQVAPGVMGQSRSFDASTASLVYQANFTDGTWGIYKVTFP